VIYGDSLAQSTGKQHNYLGMIFNFSSKNEVQINMNLYISKIIKEFPEEIIGKSATPAGDHLFKIREDGCKLDDEITDAFHRSVYQLLFAANRAHQDIQTEVSFHTTRVQSPDEDDWEKLKRIFKYLNGTRNLKLTLCADQTKYAVHWYVDGSHQIHEDCRGQTSCLATFGKGAVSSSLNEMKCNTNSMETELISFADKLTDIIWMRYFVECQGYDINKYVVFQDNMSALLLEKNGRTSSSQHTKHIKETYFLIKDYYDAGVINVKFCPTNQMWADVLTKLLQGQKFRDIWAFLQNCPQDYKDNTEVASPMTPQDVASLRECVGENTKSPLKTQPASPTCVSITAGGKAKVSWGENRINTFPVNSNFSVRHTQEQHMAKSKSSTPPPSLTISLSGVRDKLRLGEDGSDSRTNSHNLDNISDPNVFVWLHHDGIKC
jgi:hypothetical protein